MLTKQRIPVESDIHLSDPDEQNGKVQLVKCDINQGRTKFVSKVISRKYTEFGKESSVLCGRTRRRGSKGGTRKGLNTRRCFPYAFASPAFPTTKGRLRKEGGRRVIYANGEKETSV
jgi:hypothetical protein